MNDADYRIVTLSDLRWVRWPARVAGVIGAGLFVAAATGFLAVAFGDVEPPPRGALKGTVEMAFSLLSGWFTTEFVAIRVRR